MSERLNPMFDRLRWLLALAVCHALLLGGRASAQLVDRAKLDALARPLIDGGWVYGAAVGLVNEKGIQVAAYGRASETDPAPPRVDAIFEIGSISKVFTGLLLAQMVERHEVELTDPVQTLLGESMTVPKRGTREITLADLATQSSGLPRMPNNFRPKDPANPYADYTVEQLAEFVSKYQLSRDPGERYEYSNLGMGLLGHALALKEGTSYEALVRKQICEPLGMSDTCITLDEKQRARLAVGHDAQGNQVANWDLPAMVGAGAIRSTLADMLKFLSANLGLTKTTFDAAVADSQAIRFKSGDGSVELGLAWHIQPGKGVVWHNGGTGGYHSLAAIMPEKHAGVVVLTSTAGMHVDRWGFGLLKLLLDGESEPLKLPQPIELSADAIAPFVGTYKLGGATTTVSREGDRLFVQLTGQPKLRVYAEAKDRFFYREVGAAVTFETDDDGKVTRMVLHQNGRDIPAPRSE
jgi:CubicO group peptidase (beta-lactamase class C family)